jgi:hypothetical protein
VTGPTRLKIGRQSYDVSSLNKDAIAIVESLRRVETRIQEKQNLIALLLKAKNAYIADLNAEIVQERSGVDLGALFADD